jgi:peptidoglycan hydrolase-like protein with peptidoglycan-binding domain
MKYRQDMYKNGDRQMRKKSFMYFAAIFMAVIMVLTPVSASAATLLKRGSKGTEVNMVQTTLKELGYYTYSKTTGYYGSITEVAVKRFQKANGIAADGIIGKKTMSVLNNIAVKSKSTEDNEVQANTKIMAVSGSALMMASVETTEKISGDLDWFKEVRNIWDRGEDAVVTDVETGKSFQVRRTYGTNHADVEPLTKDDTNIIKEIWGGFSWDRRAVVVQIGEYILAASMTAMPHAGVDSQPAGKYVSGRSQGYGRGYNLDAVKNNGASGVMDIHFKNSRTHTTNTKQKSMQDMVKKAADYIKSEKM